MPVMDRPEDYRGLVRLYSELPEEVRGTLVRVEAWHRLDTTFDQGWDGKCEYCVGVMDGDTGSLPVCEHYRYLSETIFPAQQALWASVGSQWSDLEMCSLDLLHEPDWEELPEGYFAVPDPRSGTDEMTYWRRKDGKRGLSWGAWPTKARYGWVLLRRDVPADLPPEISRNTYARAFYKTLGWPYQRAIVEAIAEDPIAAQHRFADFNTRCCYCGKRLTNDLSKVHGIGPECRKGLSSEVLANYFRPAVGKAHAERQ